MFHVKLSFVALSTGVTAMTLLVTDEPPRIQAKVITYGNAPGYRDFSVTIEITDPWNGGRTRQIELALSADDSTSICRAMLRTQSLAWHRDRPLDALPHEQKRPTWIPIWGTV
jgi:hypothetical protein